MRTNAPQLPGGGVGTARIDLCIMCRGGGGGGVISNFYKYPSDFTCGN